MRAPRLRTPIRSGKTNPRPRTRPESHSPGAPAAGVSRQEKLLARLKAAERSLRAIPTRDVDALVVRHVRGAQVVTLMGGESAYRMLVEAMSEGAATVSHDGAVLYCNRRFAELIGPPAARLIGARFHSLLDGAERDRFNAFLRRARKQSAKGEFTLRSRAGRLVPVHLSLSRLRGYRGQALGIVITDLSEQRRRQEERIRQSDAIHRLVLKRELAAQEAERRRIARELHGEAGQLLTSLLLGLRRLEDSTDLAGCKGLGRQMRKIAARAIDDLGRLARGLHPLTLEDHGLNAAVAQYVTEYSKTHKVAVHVSMDKLDAHKLPPAVQIALYRILQETLSNVVRHARARSVQVNFKHSARALEMSVIDDGHGFNVGAVAVDSSSHLGLQSIRERAAMLGGKAAFESGNQGTQVAVQIPLRNWRFPAVTRREKA